MFKHLHFLFLILFFFSCEKDDICIEGSENTKRITIGFIDNESKNPTVINLSFIKGINNDSIIESFTGDKLKSDTEILKKTGWIREISIVKDSIFNEEKTNIFIHF